MNVTKRKEFLKRKIERQKQKTLIKEAKLRGKIEGKKSLSSLERELAEAKHIDIPEEDMKLIANDEEKTFKHKAKLFLAVVGKWIGEYVHDWAERSRKEKEAQRKLWEKEKNK